MYSVSVPVSGKISFVVMIPPFELKTEKARGVLPTEYSREGAAPAVAGEFMIKYF